jgi:4-diphosphocytidyl-2-C-methyl-D-erythritol kinase
MIGPAVNIAAQAKLNLHLRVLSRDRSGYHSLETIFHRIDLADDIIVEITERARTLDVDGADTGPVESNLAWKAAAAYSEATEWPKGFDIRLTKRIPVGAGLGGGSADAAAVLRALNSLAPRPVQEHELMQLAARLGSDIPFLASDAVMAMAWGRGERMLALSALAKRNVVLLTPAFSVSTADAYRWIDDERGPIGESAGAVVFDQVDLSSWDKIAKFARNDFESVVSSRHPELSEHIAHFRTWQTTMAGMTGSGSTVFAVLDSQGARAEFPDGLRSRVTSTTTSAGVVPPVRVG